MLLSYLFLPKFTKSFINQLRSICQCENCVSAFSYTLNTFYNQRWCPLLASRKNGRLKHFQQHIFKLTRLHPSFLYSLWSKMTPLSALHQLYTILFVWPKLECVCFRISALENSTLQQKLNVSIIL